MDSFSTIIIVLLPTLAVLVIAFLLFKYQTEQMHRNWPGSVNKESKPKSNKQHVNFQAYERLVLYLERINPANMVIRMHKPGMSSKLLQSELVKSIREEYEHNLSQQIYVSDETWELISKARHETVNLINLASQKVGDQAKGIDLSKVLIELANKVDKLPHDVAIHYLKAEMRKKLTGSD